MASFNFGPLQLAVGQHTFGPVAAVFTTANIVINRTGTGSHPWPDTLTSQSTLDVAIQGSTDGVTFFPMAEATMTCGIQNNNHGVQATTWSLGFGADSSPGDTVQAVVTVAGPSAIEISGSITTS